MGRLSKLLGITLGLKWVCSILQNSFGQEEVTWKKTYGSSEYFIGNDIATCDDGGYMITGFSSDGMFVMKVDAHGDSIWAKSYGDGIGHSIIQTSTNDFVVAGYLGGYIAYLKIDGKGDTIWARTFGKKDMPGDIISLQQTDDGGIIICAKTRKTRPPATLGFKYMAN